MKGIGRFCVFNFVLAGMALLLAGYAAASERPEWEFSILESERAQFEAAKFHEREDGSWLLTFRMRAKSLKLVPPISKIEFEGKVLAEEEDAEDEVVWTESLTIRRKDFEAAYGGGRSQFVRFFFKDVPPEVALVEMSYFRAEESE